MASSPFLDQVRRILRTHHYSYRTEQSYVHWIKRFILHNGKRHPSEMGRVEVAAFLSWLANEHHVAASTQNQALNALNFLYTKVLERPFGELEDVVRAKKPGRLPVVLSQAEVVRLLGELSGVYWLMGSLMYGSGLRLMECLRLRVKDIDLDYRTITVRAGKGNKDRTTILPDPLIDHISHQIDHAGLLHEKDLADGYTSVALPYALERKYPNAGLSLGWRFLFPAPDLSRDPRSGTRRRHHVHSSNLQRAVKSAVRRADLRKPASSHTLRHYAACRIMPNGLHRSGGALAG